MKKVGIARLISLSNIDKLYDWAIMILQYTCQASTLPGQAQIGQVFS